MADSTQLDINQQINKLLVDRIALMKSQETLLNNQIGLATALCNALECGSLDDLEDRLKGVRDILKDVSDDSGDFGSDIEEGADRAGKKALTLSEAIRKLKDDFVKLNPVMAATAAGAATGFVRGIGSAWQSIKNLTSGLFDIIKTLGNLALSILSIPFKILEGLFDLAQGGGGGPSPIRVELENIRKEFGSLATNEGRAVAGSLKEIRSEYSNVAKSGLSIRRIFGPGLEGMAKALAENTELAKALGASLTGLRDLIDDNANQLMIYRKGMGLTSEQEAFILKNSRFMGKKPMDVMRQFASMSIRMGNQFGINAKIISKSMAELATDTAHFGGLGPKVFGSIATYAHKLGIEIKDLAGVMDAFDDFESGAVAASKLAQSLNMNINSLEMLDTDDAAQRVEYLRQRFRESGNTYEQLTRQQKKYLQSTANMTDQLAAAAFGQGNMNKSYKEFQKASESAEKKVMTQEEAMKRLADSIERVFGSGGGSKFKSFFDAFTSGFASGIMRTREFRQAMRALRRAIRAVFLGGRQVGRLFVQLFPGVKKFFVGLKELFDPNRFRGLMKGVRDAFKDLFLALRTDPKAGIEKFLKTFKDLLKNFFMRSGSGAKAVFEGGKEFLKALYGIFQAVFPMVLDALAKAAEMITEFLSHPPDLQSPIVKAFDGLVNALIPMFVMIGEKLGPPFAKLFKVMWEKAKPYVMTWIKWMGYVGLAKIILNTLGGAFMGAIGGAASKIAAVGMEKFLTKIGLIKIPTPPPVSTGTVTPDTTSGPTPPPAAAAAAKLPIGQVLLLVAGLIVLAGFVIWLMRKANVTTEEIMSVSMLIGSLSASAAMIILATSAIPKGSEVLALDGMKTIGGIMAGIGILSFIIVGVLSTIKKINMDVVIAFSVSILSLTLATIPLMATAAIIGMMGKAVAAAATTGMIIVGVFMLAMGIAGVAMVEALSSINISDPAGLAAVMSALAEIFLAVVPLLGVAALMGYIASSGPVGIVGAAIIVAGFATISYIMVSLVDNMIPAIEKLSKINVPNIESFKAVVGAITAIADSTYTLLKGVSLLSLSLAPTSGINPAEFRKNAEKMSEIVNSIISSGIGDIITKLMDFARTASVKQGTGEIISAIGGVLSGAAQLAQAFAPSEAAGKAIVEISTSFFSEEEDVGKMIRHIERMMPMMRKTMLLVLPELGKLIGRIVQSLSGISISDDVKNIGPLISAMGSIFTAVAALVNALSPSDAAWKSLSDTLTATMATDSGQQAMFDLFIVDMKRRLNNMVPIMENIRTLTIDLIKGIKGPITEMAASLSGMNTENLKTVIPLVSTVLEFSTGLISNIGPVLESANKASEKSKFGEQTTNFRAALGSIMWAMKELGPVFQALADPMKIMIKGVIDVATGIPNSRGLKGKIDVVTASIQAVAALTSIFGKSGEFASSGGNSSVIANSLIDSINDNMQLVTDRLLTANGPLVNMAKTLSSLDFGNTRNIKKNTTAIKNISEGVGEISAAFSSGSGIAQFGSTTFGAGSGGFIEALQGKIDLFTRGQGAGIFVGMKNVIDQIPAGVANRSESISNMASTLAAVSESLKEIGITGDELSAYVELNNALKGSGKLTIEHKNLNISLNVHVQMSAEQIAQGIIKVNDVIPGGKKQKFVTQDY